MGVGGVLEIYDVGKITQLRGWKLKVIEKLNVLTFNALDLQFPTCVSLIEGKEKVAVSNKLSAIFRYGI